MGEQGEEQIHIAWGKRGSDCDTSAAFPSQGGGLYADDANDDRIYAFWRFRLDSYDSLVSADNRWHCCAYQMA